MGGGVGGGGVMQLEFDLWHHLPNCFSPACNLRENAHSMFRKSNEPIYISINIYIYKYIINNK